MLHLHRQNLSPSISMAHLEIIAVQAIKPSYKNKIKYESLLNSIVHTWKDRDMEEIDRKKYYFTYDKEQVCELIEQRIISIINYNFNEVDKLLEISDDIYHIVNICTILKLSGAKKAKAIEKNIDVLNIKVKKSLIKKISSLQRNIHAASIAFKNNPSNEIHLESIDNINQNIKKIQIICSNLSKNPIFKKIEKQIKSLANKTQNLMAGIKPNVRETSTWELEENYTEQEDEETKPVKLVKETSVEALEHDQSFNETLKPQEAMATGPYCEVTALPANYFDLIDQSQADLITWKEELTSIASGNFIDFSMENHIALLKNCCNLVLSSRQNINSDLKRQMIQEIKKELQHVANIQNQILPKICDYLDKYLQAVKSQIKQEKEDPKELEKSLATLNYFICGLEKASQEIASICSILNQELVDQTSSFANEIKNILKSLNKHLIILSKIKENAPKTTFNSPFDIDVRKQWDSLQIRHTFRFQNSDMIDVEKEMRAASGEKVIPKFTWVPSTPPILKLNSLRNIVTVGLYCLKFPFEYMNASAEFRAPSSRKDSPVSSHPTKPNLAVDKHEAPILRGEPSSLYDNKLPAHHIEPIGRKPVPVAEEVAEIIRTYSLFSLNNPSNHVQEPDIEYSGDIQETSKVSDLTASEEGETVVPQCEPLKKEPVAISVESSFIPTTPILENEQLTTLASQSIDVRRLHTFLASPARINTQIFAHLIGHDNPMIHAGQDAKMPMEGMSSANAIYYQLGIAETMLEAMQQVPLDNRTSSLSFETILGAAPSIAASVRNNPPLLRSLIDQLRIAQHIQEPGRYGKYSDIVEYRNRIVQQVHNLKLGQSFFFPGGWIAKEKETQAIGGHAIAWVITKQQDGRLTIQLHNTGSGLEYHFSKIIGLEERFLLVTEIEDVDPKQFTSSSFIQGVFNLQTILIPEYMKGWGAEDMYRGLLIGMGGSLSVKQYSLNELARPQFVGICAMESVMSAMGSFMEGEAFATLYRYWATLKGVVSYFELIQNASRGQLSEEDRLYNELKLFFGFEDKTQVEVLTEKGLVPEQKRRLVYDGLKVLAGLAVKAHSARVLTDSELDYTLTIIRQIKQRLQNLEGKSADNIVATESLVTYKVPAQPLQSGIRGLQFSKIQETNIEKVRPLTCIESEAFSANPATIVEDLGKLLNEIHLGNHERQNYLEVQKAIRGIVLKIPLQDVSFWSKIDETAAHKMLTIFADMSKELLWSLINNDELPSQKTHLSAEDYLCQAKILTLADYIIHHYNNPLGMEIPSLFQEIAKKTQGAPEWEVQHFIMDEYWQNFFQNNVINENEDFFGFKLYPAGNTGEVNFRFNMNDDFLRVKKNELNRLAGFHGEYKWIYGYFDEHQNPIQPKQFDFVWRWAMKNLKKIREMDPNFNYLEDLTTVVLKHIDELPMLRDAFLISYVFNFLSTGSFDIPKEIPYDRKHPPVKTIDYSSYDFSKSIKINVENFSFKQFKHFLPVNYNPEDYPPYEYIDIKCSGISYSLFGRSPYIANIDSTLVTKKIVYESWFFSTRIPRELIHINYQQLLKNKQIEFCKYLSEIFKNKDKLYPSNSFLNANMVNCDGIELVRQDPSKVVIDEWPVSTLQRFREINTLYSNALVQIQQTAGYFLGNSENNFLLSDSKFATLFYFLITEGDLLRQRIKESPHAASEMAADFQKRLNLAQKAQDVNSMIILAGMSARFQEIYEREKENDSAQFFLAEAPQFLNARNILAGVMLSKEINAEQRGRASHELAISFRRQRTLTPGEATLLIQAVINTHIYNIHEGYHNDYQTTHEVDFLIRDYFMPQLRSLMEGENRDQILSHVLLAMMPNAQSGKWNSPDNFPYYVSPCGNYRLNLIEGTIKPITEGAVVLFDNNLLKENEFVREIFAEDPPKIMTKTAKGIEIQSNTGESYQLVYDNFLRKFGDHWFQMQSSSSIKFENHAILAGNHLWYYETETTWSLEPGPTTGDAKVFVTDGKSKKPVYRIEINRSKVQKIIKLDDQGSDTDFVLVNSNREEVDVFRRLEAPNYIMAWSQGEVIRRVDLPRFELTFTIKEVNGKRMAFCDEFPGYVLAEGTKQHIPELGNLRHYLHLQRIEKDCSVSEKVIFARQPLKPYTQGSYLTDAEPDRNIQSGATLQSQRYIDFQFLNGELVPSTTYEDEAIEANLFLAMTHLAERHSIPSNKDSNPYTKAHHYFERANNQILRQRVGLSNNALEILTWINNEEITKDKHPDAIALRVKAKLIIGRDELDFKSQKSPKIDLAITSNYTEYLAHLNYVDASLRLSRGEELHLLNIIGINDERLAHRYQQLNSRSDVIQATLSRNVPFINPALTTINVSSFSFPSNLNDPNRWINMLMAQKHVYHFQNPIFLRIINHDSRFIKYYAIARAELPANESIKELNEGMGLHLSDSLSQDEIIQEMKTALKMTLATYKDLGDGFIIKLLLAVTTNPTAFTQSSSDLKLHFARLEEKIKERVKKKDELEMILKLPLEHDFERKKERKINSQLKTILKEISTLEIYFKEHLQTPTEKLEKSINLSINISQKKVKESERLKRDKDLAKQPKTVVKKDFAFAECINLAAETGIPVTNQTLVHPIIPIEAMEQLVQRTYVQSLSQDVLPPLFQGTPKNPTIAKFFAEAEIALAEYTKQASENNYNYEVADSAKIIKLQKALFQNAVVLENDLHHREVELLQFANRGTSNIGELAKRDLQVEQGSIKLLTLDELNRAFFQRDFEILHKRNPHLSKEEMTQLFTKIENYLLDATYLQQEKRIIKKAEVLRKSIENNLSGFALKEIIRAFYETVESVRVYNPHDYPEYLVFEYYNDILIWKQQADTLEAFKKKDLKGALIELAMGLGKSAVISPFLAWMAADGEQIASIVTTTELLPAMAKELQATNERVFAQKTRSLAIKREEITIARLQRLFDNLDEVRKERFALAWTANDILCLFNQWVELNEFAYELQRQSTLTPEALDQYSNKRSLFLKSFRLLKESASLSIDEIHKVLDILQSHSFTFGKPKEVHPEITSGVVKLIQAIITDENLYQTIRWEFLPQSKGEGFTEEAYQKTIKGKIIDALIEHSLSSKNPIYREFLGKLTSEEKQQLKDYLAEGIGADQGYGLLSNLEYKKIDNINAKKIRNELATLKETINNIFSRAAGKKSLVDLGKDEDGIEIVPYHDGVATENSIFGNILERLIYAIEYDLSQGISVDVVQQKIQQLKDKYKASLSLNEEHDLSEFHRLVGGSKEFDLIKFDNIEYAAKNYRKIAKIINQQPTVALELIAEYRLPNIKVYAKEIESSTHIIPLLAKEVRGMSGTLFNVPTFPKIFQPPKLSDTQAKTLNILRKNSAQRVVTLHAARSLDTLKMIDDNEIEPTSSLIDATGVFSGLENEKIARFMLKKLTSEKKSKIQGVVHYDGNIRKVITVKDRKPVVYTKDMDKESLAAFWDLPHITGSDIILGQFMKANMVVGKDITLVSLPQGVWRLRGLATGQAVNFIVQEKDKQIMSKMLKEHLDIDIPEGEDLTFPQLITFAYLNLALKESKNTYQAIQEGMKVAFIKHLSNVMWDENVSGRDALTIYGDTRSLFIKEEVEEPWERWGHPVKEIQTHEALQGILKEWKENPLITKIRNNPTLYREFDLALLFKDWDEIINEISGPLPEKVKTTTQTYGKTTEQIVEEQTEQNTEELAEQHIEKEVEMYLYKEHEKKYVSRQRIPIDNPFRLKDSIPTPLERLSAISEDVLVSKGLRPEIGLCVKANDLVQIIKKTENLGILFNENLLISLNLAPLHGISKNTEKIGAGMQYQYVPFDKFQKACTFVQVIQEKKTGKIRLKLIDEIEAGDLKDFIPNEEREARKDRGLFQNAISSITRFFQGPIIEEVNVGLYQLQQTSHSIDKIGKQPIDLTKQEVHEEFMELLVQARFVVGRINFLPEELPYVEKWVAKVGVIQAFELINIILNPFGMGATRKNFSKSQLAQIFENLGIPREQIDAIK